jgi:hypothetical protein
MRGRSSNRILASMVLAAILVAPFGALAQDSNTSAVFMRSKPTSTQPSPKAAEVKKERNIMTSTRVVGAKRPGTRVVVEPRSFLDAGTEVLPGERKFLDYAFSPTHTPMDEVQNTGGRVGWHNSPLPGPFFPWQ